MKKLFLAFFALLIVMIPLHGDNFGSGFGVGAITGLATGGIIGASVARNRQPRYIYSSEEENQTVRQLRRENRKLNTLLDEAYDEIDRLNAHISKLQGKVRD